MERSKLETDRCILFPRAEGAVIAIDNMQIDSRFEIEVIDLNYSSLSKLQIFGFFNYPAELGIIIVKNGFYKIPSNHLPLIIETALLSRKQTNDHVLLKLIDTFVNKTKRSIDDDLPIWFNT